MGKKQARRRAMESQKKMEQEFKELKSGIADGPVRAESPRDKSPEVSPPFPPAKRPQAGPSACLNRNLELSMACLVSRFRRKSICMECARA